MTIAPPPSSSSSAEGSGTSGPGPSFTTEPLDCAGAERLGERIQQQAAHIAEATCELLLMVAEFDAREGSGCFVGVKSTAHWLAWACSMSPGTAREHVRVARALPAMPRTVEEFRAGRLSYSKVREMTRVADRVEEEVLVDMARAMTASQLARTLSAFRAVDGSRLGQEANRQARWQVREDGMIEIRAVLPAETGAEVVTALELARDRDGTAPPAPDAAAHRAAAPASLSAAESGAGAGAGSDAIAERSAEITGAATLEQRGADALHNLARTYLDAEPDDRSGEDRHLVVVEVSAESLRRGVPAGTPGAPSEHVPAGTSDGAAPEGRAAPDVPAGTPQRCGVLDAGPLEARTAERLACTGQVALKITDAGGEILHLGRSRRLASRAQRRALRLRDTTCTFPGCHQAKHLDAHHTTPWSEGGTTDLEGLALLCRRHHVMVHEGGLRLVRDPARSSPHQPRFQVLDGTGRPVQARWPALFEHLLVAREEEPSVPVGPGADGARTDDDEGPPGAGARPTDPARIAATTGGEGFCLADCVDALLQHTLDLAA
ncbi:DUF222 domain-containing protein [Brachybacterium sp. AOP43-C2-M15]|uniref:DUF222 domain-containing protein n=1 Tax=Brachybacterium sp. AOP43-C2-M15 TaxID=3457661 RepID=UPI004034096B